MALLRVVRRPREYFAVLNIIDMDMTIVMPCAIFLSALDKSMMAGIPEGSVLTS